METNAYDRKRRESLAAARARQRVEKRLRKRRQRMRRLAAACLLFTVLLCCAMTIASGASAPETGGEERAHTQESEPPASARPLEDADTVPATPHAAPPEIPAQDTSLPPPAAATPKPRPEQPPPQEQALIAPPKTPAPQPDTPSGDWNLILVNSWNPLPEGYGVALTTLRNGHAIDERAYPDLQQMMDDCRAAGLSPVICSSYRTWEKQERLFDNEVQRLTKQGYSQENAKTEAAKCVAVPGASEHQLGLAVDLVDINNQILDSSQEQTAVQKWLMAHSWEYGFILRYPNGKSDVTGIIYEPWHYRYVGKEAAKEIYDKGICLEEYLA